MPARSKRLSWGILNQVEQDEPPAISYNPRRLRWRSRYGLWRPRHSGWHATSTIVAEWLSCYTVAAAVAVAVAAASAAATVVIHLTTL